MVDVNLPSVDDLLSSVSVPSISFKNAKVGDSFTGTIIGLDSVQVRDFATGDPKFWDDGKPQMQVQVTLDTAYTDADLDEDDGTRRVYLFGQKLSAARQALKEAGAQKFEIGMEFTITLSGTKPAKTKGFNDVKLYSITLAAAKSNAAVDALLEAGAKPVVKGSTAGKLSDEQHAKALKLDAAGFDASEIASTLGVAEEDVLAALTF
jgi:hypothetical protein